MRYFQAKIPPPRLKFHSNVLFVRKNQVGKCRVSENNAKSLFTVPSGEAGGKKKKGHFLLRSFTNFLVRTKIVESKNFRLIFQHKDECGVSERESSFILAFFFVFSGSIRHKNRSFPFGCIFLFFLSFWCLMFYSFRKVIILKAS